MIPYIIDPLIDDLPLKENEYISAVSAHDRNVYIGTSKGNILHYHLFEDATDYLLITLLSIGAKEVSQMVASEQLQKLFLTVDRTLMVYLLPELSPINARQLKNVRRICLTTNGLMLVKQSGVHIVQLQENTWKLIREFKYEGAVSGAAPINNLILLANDESYEVLDTRSGRAMPLFGYKSDANVSPLIVPFETPHSTEYLLTVASDENTSIAQFINDSGDVTRGTLTWLGLGYPRGGVLISWPYAFALFEHSIVVSSLETLETVMEIDVSALSGEEFHIQDVTVFFMDKSLEAVTGLPTELSSSKVLFNKSKLFVVRQENELVSANKLFLEAMESNDFEHFLTPLDGDSKYLHILKTMAAFLTEKDPIELLIKKKNGHLIIEPNLALRLLGYDFFPAKVYPGLKDVIDMWDFKDEEITKRYLLELKPAEMSDEARLLSYKLLSELAALVSMDKWTFSENDKLIINELIERNQITQVSRVYQMIPTLPAVASAYKDFLSQHLNADLIDDALKFLSEEQLDEKDYSKLILDIIKLNKSKGYAFMRKSTRYREINQKILNELSDDLKGEIDYALLRIELLESTFNDNMALRKDLSNLVCSTLSLVYNDDAKEYLRKLHEEYKEMNRLSKDKWPKITWIDFLGLARGKNYQIFTELYIKAFELVDKDDALDEPLFAYHKLCKTQDVLGLLKFGDYSSAEQVSLGKPVSPQKRHYKLDSQQADIDIERLLLIFKHYLESYEHEPVEPAIRHFVESYSHFISPVTLIKLLPNQFPLAFLTKFLKTSLLSLQNQSREKVMTKSIIKSELSRTKHLINDFL